ncbi:BRCT domain-containing protein [Cephalotus follicularis]|uniref:BRCT domain-containing protein n=1 Tax=Cephalotus follicularis TaxID=3775 RepID=A0A1Q3BX64_CEPFO|nr:BRCT domain-containing protein [Cephalotus follicularis]
MKKEKRERKAIVGDEFMFVLVNPKDADSGTKSYLQEVLKIYSKELPAMNYAANTGKESMFLKKCVSNGKYRTLLLKSKFTLGTGEVMAAITYQIVPADTQYAEIPLAAVCSIHQHKGFGHLLYMELRNRLQGVGICTILCWGDKESEGFWIKQGFASIAEVNKKGRAQRLPIKSDIRRALCLPGGSTLMVSYLNKDTSVHPADPPPLVANKSVVPEFPGNINNTLKSHNQLISSTESWQAEGPAKERSPSEDIMSNYLTRSEDLKREYGDPASSKGVECNNMASGAELVKIEATADVKHCSCSEQGSKRKIWQASLSSLKSKRVKGSHCMNCQSDSSWDIVPESDRNYPSLDGCSIGIYDIKSFEEVTPGDPLTKAKDGGKVNMTSDVITDKEFQPKAECFRIMLMNIADETKKTHLKKVIKNLGGAVTYDGSLSTHVVTGKARKTLNFCTALCSGAWVVSPSWLRESFHRSRFVDESPYLLHDEDYMLKFRTELKYAVLRAKTRPRALLQGYSLCISRHVQPTVKILSVIVRSAGGNIISGLDKENEESKTIFIACEEDMEEALSAAKKGIWTFGSDWLINCVMRQELELEAPQFAESL